MRQAQQTIGWADHLVIFYPLWLGTMPALLKAFLELVPSVRNAINMTLP
ncbi:MAG: NAD(P)H-dependent oxidoreductase [Candidatus Entotheonellia bacterium]